MILTDSLLYKIDQKLNKLSSNAHQAIPVEDKILALNEAQIVLIKNKVTGIDVGNNGGFGSSKKRFDDLQVLVVDFKKGELELTKTNSELNQWSAPLSLLSPKYMFYIDAYVIADKGRCKDKKLWVNPDLVKNGDISFMLNNTHLKPSFEYEETCSSLSSEHISVYTDGTFTPKQIYLSYLRYPNRIDKEGYETLEGLPSIDQNCELPDYMEDELVDLTVQNLAEYTENMAAVQSSQLRIRSNPNI